MAASEVAGLGCYDPGLVYPASITPGLSTTDRPGTGPTQAGKTWDQAPSAFGAVDPSPVELDINVTSISATAILINGLNIHVLSRNPQVKGVWLNIVGQCGAGPCTQKFSTYDLDTPYPYAVPLASGMQDCAMSYPYPLAPGGTLSLVVHVQSEHCDCTWDANLTWVDGTAPQALTIDDKGRPFESTSTAGIPGTTWGYPGAFGTTGWARMPMPTG